MITYDEALKIAKDYLYDPDYPLVITKQGEVPEGWYFCYDSKAFVETGDPSECLAGNGPFLIDKETGKLHVFGTAQPLEMSLQEYRTNRANN